MTPVDRLVAGVMVVRDARRCSRATLPVVEQAERDETRPYLHQFTYFLKDVG